MVTIIVWYCKRVIGFSGSLVLIFYDVIQHEIMTVSLHRLYCTTKSNKGKEEHLNQKRSSHDTMNEAA